MEFIVLIVLVVIGCYFLNDVIDTKVSEIDAKTKVKASKTIIKCNQEADKLAKEYDPNTTTTNQLFEMINKESNS